jgi:hypothetical protein
MIIIQTVSEEIATKSKNGVWHKSEIPFQFHMLKKADNSFSCYYSTFSFHDFV